MYLYAHLRCPRRCFSLADSQGCRQQHDFALALASVVPSGVVFALEGLFGSSDYSACGWVFAEAVQPISAELSVVCTGIMLVCPVTGSVSELPFHLPLCQRKPAD